MPSLKRALACGEELVLVDADMWLKACSGGMVASPTPTVPISSDSIRTISVALVEQRREGGRGHPSGRAAADDDDFRIASSLIGRSTPEGAGSQRISFDQRPRSGTSAEAEEEGERAARPEAGATGGGGGGT